MILLLDWLGRFLMTSAFPAVEQLAARNLASGVVGSNEPRWTI
jgi:hypothetical protein